jgi:hypothetical protein
MLRKLLSLGAVIVVAVAFGAGAASAKQTPPGKLGTQSYTGIDGFSDGRLLGFSDGR